MSWDRLETSLRKGADDIVTALIARAPQNELLLFGTAANLKEELFQASIAYARDAHERGEQFNYSALVQEFIAKRSVTVSVTSPTARRRRSGTTYRVNLVAEQHYQPAVGSCCEGDEILIWHEPDNPHDSKALVATTVEGVTLGYIPRDNFVQDVVHEQQLGVSASILCLDERKGFLQIVLSVVIENEPVKQRAYTRA